MSTYIILDNPIYVYKASLSGPLYGLLTLILIPQMYFHYFEVYKFIASYKSFHIITENISKAILASYIFDNLNNT